MPDRTLLYLTDDTGAHLRLWRQQGDAVPKAAAMGGWDDPAVHKGLKETAECGDTLWVVMPAAWGSLLQVPIPSRRREQAQQALYFAIEDLVVDDVDSLHITLGNEPLRVEKGLRWPVLVMNAAQRTVLLARLDEYGLRPQGVLHPLDLWPVPEPGQWNVYLDDDRETLAVVTGPHAGFVLPLGDRGQNPAGALSVVLSQMQDSESRPQTVVVHGWDNGDEGAMKTQEHPTPEQDAAAAFESRPAAEWPAVWLSAIARRQPLSAIEPAGAGRRRRQRRQWAWVAALLVLLGLGLTAERAISGWQAAAQSQKLRAQISRDFHTALPDVKRLVNARVQLEQAIAAVSGGGRNDGFLLAMSALAQGMSGAQAQDKALSLTHVSFRDGRLVADLSGKEYDALQKLYGQLRQQAGLRVKRLASGVEGGKAHMRLEIATNGAGGQG